MKTSRLMNGRIIILFIFAMALLAACTEEEPAPTATPIAIVEEPTVVLSQEQIGGRSAKRYIQGALGTQGKG